MVTDNFLPEVAVRRKMAQSAVDQLKGQAYEAVLQYVIVKAQDSPDKAEHLAALEKRTINLRHAIEAAQFELNKLPNEGDNAEATHDLQ